MIIGNKGSWTIECNPHGLCTHYHIKIFFGRTYNSINSRYMVHAFADFSQTLSFRHVKMRINLTSLNSIFIINYGLETVVLKFNCLVLHYKSIISCRMRGINRTDDLKLIDSVKEGIWYFATYLPYYNSLRIDSGNSIVSNNRKHQKRSFFCQINYQIKMSTT